MRGAGPLTARPESLHRSTLQQFNIAHANLVHFHSRDALPAARLTNHRLCIPRCPGGQSLAGCAGPWCLSVCASFRLPTVESPLGTAPSNSRVQIRATVEVGEAPLTVSLTVVICLVLVLSHARVVAPQSLSPPDPPPIHLTLYPTLTQGLLFPCSNMPVRLFRRPLYYT